MATKAPFLSQRYGAYHHREVPREDEELTHVGPGTPSGEYLRRFWHPILTTDELKDLPVAVRIMGEDLVAFRDHKGRIGLLELHCTHRGTSLEYGQIEEEGIRCCYHGWLYGVDGAILDTPGEPPESTFKDRLCQGAYPVIEHHDLIFTYMGPPDKQPELPIYDTECLPGFTQTSIVRHHWPCNWLQVKDNCMDPAHTAFLHTIEMGHGFSDAFKEFGTLDWIETPIGSIYIHSRRIGDNVWVRSSSFILPSMHQIPLSREDGTQTHGMVPATNLGWLVPIDDTNCTTLIRWYDREGAPTRSGGGFGQDGDRPLEDRQRSPGDWDAQVTQRPIAVHGMERLGATDRGVVLLRRLVREGIRAVARGEDPKGVAREPGQIIPTYSHNTVVHAPAAPTPEEDTQLLLATGRRVAESYVANPPTLEEREVQGWLE